MHESFELHTTNQRRPKEAQGVLRIGVGGPVGSGKTMLLERMTRRLSTSFSVAAITNDIYTTEDAAYMREHSVLAHERIRAVETGGCPHTAIREDASANLEASNELFRAIPGLQMLFLESGGDNLTSTFSPELVDVSIFVIDVAQGDKIPRKGGPGICRSDLLVINKIDLAPYVGANLARMASDASEQRGSLPTVFTNLAQDLGVDQIEMFLRGHYEAIADAAPFEHLSSGELADL